MASDNKSDEWQESVFVNPDSNFHQGINANVKESYCLSNAEIVKYTSSDNNCSKLNYKIHGATEICYNAKTKKFYIHNGRRQITIIDNNTHRLKHIYTTRNNIKLKHCIIIPSLASNLNLINRRFSTHYIINQNTSKIKKHGPLIPEYPNLSFFALCGYSENDYYLIGGECDKKLMSTILRFNGAEQRCYDDTDLKLPLPLSRCAATCFGKNNKWLAIFGGHDGDIYNHRGNTTIYVCDTAEHIWYTCDVELPCSGNQDISVATMAIHDTVNIVNGYVRKNQQALSLPNIPEVLNTLIQNYMDRIEQIHIFQKHSILHWTIATETILLNIDTIH